VDFVRSPRHANHILFCLDIRCYFDDGAGRLGRGANNAATHSNTFTT
jgi:hypothetical protein